MMRYAERPRFVLIRTVVYYPQEQAVTDKTSCLLRWRRSRPALESAMGSLPAGFGFPWPFHSVRYGQAGRTVHRRSSDPWRNAWDRHDRKSRPGNAIRRPQGLILGHDRYLQSMPGPHPARALIAVNNTVKFEPHCVLCDAWTESSISKKPKAGSSSEATDRSRRRRSFRATVTTPFGTWGSGRAGSTRRQQSERQN